jgi:hypothetical protein
MAPRVFVVAGLVVLCAAGCGKRGSPLAPLRLVPARIADLTAVRTAERVELHFTVPAANLDGTTPPAVDRVDIYGWPAPAGAPPMAASAIVADRRLLRTSIAVRRTDDPTEQAAGPSSPAAGERALVVDTVGTLTAAAIHYVVVPVAGSGRGRQGPPSAPAAVPLGAPPAAPVGLTLLHTEKDVRASWQAGSPGQTFRLVRTVSTSTDGARTALIPSPPTQTELSFPVEFGREVCVSVQAVDVAGAVTVDGELSRPVCLTPIDRYPPPAPTGVQLVQEGAAVTVIWTAVEASDLAGYVVLRGTGGGATNLQPLMRTPIRETTFRDLAVQSGATYVYAVYAVDGATTPNISQLSARQSVTVR